MLRSKKYLAILVGTIIVIVALLVWAKHDADAKAQSFGAAHAKLQADYKADVAKLRLSSLIDVSDNGHEDVKKEMAVCAAADTLRGKLDTFDKHALASSSGGWLSSQYDRAQSEQKATEAAREEASELLASYSARCKYSTKSTEVARATEAVRKSNAYRSQLNYNPATCPDPKGGCITESKALGFAKPYAQISAIYDEYAAFYTNTSCPLDKSQQEVCVATKKLATATAENARQYVATLKNYSRAKINELSKYTEPRQAYDQLKAITKKFDPSAKSVDDFWRKLYIAQEKQLQNIAL